MSLNLIAPAAMLRGNDAPAAGRLISIVESHGGRVLLLADGISTDSVAFWDEVARPSTSAQWAEYLSDRGWSPDETVFLADSLEQATLAGAARIKTGALKSTLASEPDPANHNLDEIWTDLDKVSQWFERHGQLTKRAWPIATVGGLVFAPDQTALFVRTAKWSGTWGVPGGKIDYGETSIDAFLREIKEETGIDAFAPQFVLVQDAIEEPEFFRPRHFLLLNFRACSHSKEVHLNHESLEAGWFTLEQAQALRLNRPTRALVDLLHHV